MSTNVNNEALETGTEPDDLADLDVLLGDAATDEEIEVTPAESEEPDEDESEDEGYEEDDSEEDDSEEDDPEEYDGEGDIELDEEDKSYSAKVQKRIMRERRLRKAEADRTQAMQQERDQASAALRQLAMNSLTEKKQDTERFYSSQAQQVAALEENLSYRMQIAQQQLQQAKENGDTAAEIRLQSEIDEARFNKRQLDEIKSNIDTQKTHELQGIDAKLQSVQRINPAQQARTEFPRAKNWLERNKTWMERPQNAAHAQFVAALDSQIMQEGYDPNSAAYYVELDRRIDKAFPQLRKRKPTKKKVAAKRGTPSAPVQKAGAQGSAASGREKIRLTKADLENMRNFGLDPNDKEHLKEYASQKRAK